MKELSSGVPMEVTYNEILQDYNEARKRLIVWACVLEYKLDRRRWTKKELKDGQ